MEGAVGGEDLGGPLGEGVVEIGDAAAGFGEDEGAGCDVVEIEVEFPEAIEATGGGVAEVQRGGAHATDALNLRNDGIEDG